MLHVGVKNTSTRLNPLPGLLPRSADVNAAYYGKPQRLALDVM